MDNAGYTTLTRQSGLLAEMQAVANNIANASTTGYRREGVIFSEFVAALGADDPSLSMATANVRDTRMEQGPLTQTGGSFDFAIEGDGFFMIEGPMGPMLTRAGSFTPNQAGELVTPDGFRLLDGGAAPIFVPPDAQIAVAADGTVSADGDPVGGLGLFLPADPNDIRHRDGVRFEVPGGTVPVIEGAVILQGFLENSNVDAVGEIARMIEIQRAYEQGQAFLEREDERIRGVLRTLGG
ncbi:flagellar hook-basal body complex protein [Maritimibacter sp. UBA3975]|uniref:flagellar hook-basal body complex protein n=1 Tax=Maritimibacter sp. UBA3975 TaxID=1946833 RepID=UPI000C0AF8C3|nr:flagellar hook-basal body complex protein [Maritimibacter sp. UBA3975]MAM61848.1 flagellar basal-body rod protein FlgF [Maritimibacter sp.]|tara:strand:- start:9052 stop:9768 length:717 start_codon:yes stop_codon:yes gene_type:complete